MQRLISDAQESFTAWHIPEPRLVFAGGNRCEDPKTGLSVWGPREIDRLSRAAIRVGVVGSGEMIQLLRGWISAAEGRIRAGRNKNGRAYDPVLFPDFPGFSERSPFRCRIEIDERLCETVTGKEIDAVVRLPNYRSRVAEMVRIVQGRLEIIGDREPGADVVVCAMPEEIDLACGPQGRVGQMHATPSTSAEKAARKLERSAARQGQLLLSFGDPERDAQDSEHWDFHNALKVRAMAVGLPTQLIWESTLRGTRDIQDPATRAWNFFTAIYYKTGNVPWELDFATPGTCFVGITFYRESPSDMAGMRTSLAQVFSESGDGLVLKGEPVEWDRERDRKPHLSRQSAQKLIERAIDLYKRHHNVNPRRVVVHKTSRFWDEERQGCQEGMSGVESFDLLALERRGIRFLRLGQEPPLRGTVIQLAKRNYLLFTRGYVPFFRVYPGMRIPNPLEVVEHHGDSTPDRVCSEILALTKLNWNNCGFASGDPITTAFSRQVGRILTELPAAEIVPQTKYRYFM